MVFSSAVFLFLFLPVLLVLYFTAPRGLRNLLLLLASLLFYAWGEGPFVALMLASIAINYGLGLLVDTRRGRRSGRIALATAIAANLGLLAWFKYAHFLAESASAPIRALGGAGLALDPIHLPIGISFFTFQALSYVIDVHRGDARAQRNPLHVALYVSLFPQLIAGPIVRFGHVAGQLARRRVDVSDFAAGVRRVSVGLAKKLLIADTLGLPADAIFALPAAELTPAAAWLGAICYALQIYFDFSGYSDMAIGLGRMFGFRFLENFDHPYVATSITEFWRRWHISLSSWFRDYLYVPLGGNRRGTARTYRNLFLVFVLCGLWHGASWTFVLWGLFHGTFLVLERAARERTTTRVPRPVKHLYALLVVLVGWVLFRAESLDGALAMLAAMAGFAAGGASAELAALFGNDVLLSLAAGVAGSTPLLAALGGLRERWIASRAGRPRIALEAAAGLSDVALLAVLLLFCAMQVSASTYSPFLYFRF